MVSPVKQCKICKEVKGLDAFNKSTPHTLRSRCKKCRNIQHKLSDCRTPSGTRRGRLRKYGLSVDRYENMLSKQDMKCAICNQINFSGFSKKHLVVDHCHITGMVRGLLCDFCNRGLGQFRDSLEFLTSAIEYLKKHQQSEAI